MKPGCFSKAKGPLAGKVREYESRASEAIAEVFSRIDHKFDLMYLGDRGQSRSVWGTGWRTDDVRQMIDGFHQKGPTMFPKPTRRRQLNGSCVSFMAERPEDAEDAMQFRALGNTRCFDWDKSAVGFWVFHFQLFLGVQMTLYHSPFTNGVLQMEIKLKDSTKLHVVWSAVSALDPCEKGMKGGCKTIGLRQIFHFSQR